LIRPEEDILFVKSPKIVTVEKVVGLIKQFKTLDINPPKGILIDLRWRTNLLGHDEAQKIVRVYLNAPEFFRGRIVFLSTTTGQYGTSRMVATLAEINNYDAHAAKDTMKACELLGIKSIPSDEDYARDGFEV